MKTQYTSPALLACAAFLGSLALGLACRIDNDQHCTFREGNATCQERYGAERPYCASTCVEAPDRDGCVSERPSDDACYYPCGRDRSVLEDDSCDDAAEGGTTEASGSEEAGSSSGPSTSMGPGAGSESTGPEGCIGDEDCEGATSFCGEAGVCVGCDELLDGDAACAGVSAKTPVCAGGTCVACAAGKEDACGGSTPVCDTAAQTCVPCGFHFQCPESACHIQEGSCFPADRVWMVDGGGGENFSSVSAGVASIGAGEMGVLVVRELGGGVSYQENLSISGDRIIAIIAADGEGPRILGTNDPTITVGSGATVYLEGLRVALNGQALGVQVSGGEAWLDACRVVQNDGGGISVNSNGHVVVRNSFVAANGNDEDAITVMGASAEVVYSSLMAFTQFETPAALRCNAGASVDVRNSVVITTQNPDIVCTPALIANSAGEVAPPGQDNVAVGTVQPGWFVGIATGNLELQGAGISTFQNIARWQLGDPPYDIRNNERPTTDGASDFAGAHAP